MNMCPVCKKEVGRKVKECPRCGAAIDGSISASAQDMKAQTSNQAAKYSATAAPGGALADRVFQIEKFVVPSLRPGVKPASKSSLLIIAFALFVSIFIYGIVDILVTQSAREVTSPPIEFFLIITLIALTNLIAGIAGTYCSIHPERLKSANGKAQLIAYIQTYYIVFAALVESVAIFGLVLVFASRERMYFFPFAAAAIIGMLFQISRLLVAPKFHDSFVGPDDVSRPI